MIGYYLKENIKVLILYIYIYILRVVVYIHTQLYPCIMASRSFQFLLAHRNFYAVFAILLMLLLPSGVIGCSRKKVARFLITDHQQIDYDPFLFTWFLYTPFFNKEWCRRRFPIYSSWCNRWYKKECSNDCGRRLKCRSLALLQ